MCLRWQSITKKVPTRFAPVYAHLSYDDAGKFTEVRFSSPGKFGDSAIEDLLDALGDAVTEMFECAET